MTQNLQFFKSFFQLPNFEENVQFKQADVCVGDPVTIYKLHK